jgi:prepilin-type N-terminal cleavage/methylation domain-containing protein
MSSSTRRAGFSLIEVVVALAILSLGMTSAIALFAAATAAHRTAIHRSQAADLAEWALADIESALLLGADPAELVGAPPTEAILRDWPGYRVEVRIQPAAGPAGEDEALVEIGIVWANRGRDQRLEFQQLVARRAQIR